MRSGEPPPGIAAPRAASGGSRGGRVAAFHALRYTFCALLARQYPIEVVSKLMRHSTIQLTSDVYLEFGPDREGEGELGVTGASSRPGKYGEGCESYRHRSWYRFWYHSLAFSS
jgi:hypothetical protein